MAPGPTPGPAAAHQGILQNHWKTQSDRIVRRGTTKGAAARQGVIVGPRWEVETAQKQGKHINGTDSAGLVHM